ncbi:ribosomal protein L12E/L44/L45/RPP1/RPP2 [Mucilaginibacter sp. HD30]
MKHIPNYEVTNLTAKKVSEEQAIKILRNNGIHVDEEEIRTILHFLYILGKAHKQNLL